MASSRSSNVVQAPSCTCKRHRLGVIAGIQKTLLTRRFLDAIEVPFHANEKRNLHALFQAFQTPFKDHRTPAFQTPFRGHLTPARSAVLVLFQEMGAALRRCNALLGIVKASYLRRFGATEAPL